MRDIIQQHFPFFKEPELVDAIANVAKEVNVKKEIQSLKLVSLLRAHH